MVDPAVNIMFSSMKRQLKEYKEKLEQAQNDLTAWKFTPDRCAPSLTPSPNSHTHPHTHTLTPSHWCSVTGKKIMAKCRSLIQENAELGKQISQVFHTDHYLTFNLLTPSPPSPPSPPSLPSHRAGWLSWRLRLHCINSSIRRSRLLRMVGSWPCNNLFAIILQGNLQCV